jgi:hypothetical protein
MPLGAVGEDDREDCRHVAAVDQGDAAHTRSSTPRARTRKVGGEFQHGVREGRGTITPKCAARGLFSISQHATPVGQGGAAAILRINKRSKDVTPLTWQLIHLMKSRLFTGKAAYSFPSYPLSAWEGERTPVALIASRRSGQAAERQHDVQ